VLHVVANGARLADRGPTSPNYSTLVRVPALVLEASPEEVVLRNARDFDTVLKLGIGEAYCLTDRELDQIRPGWYVIVLDRTNRRRADGRLVRIASARPEVIKVARPCARGRARYDVHCQDLTEVEFDAALPPLSDAPKRRKKDGALQVQRSAVQILR
jgi:hypothetical protein